MSLSLATLLRAPEIIQDREIIEIAVQSAEGIGSAYNGGVNEESSSGSDGTTQGAGPGKMISEMSFARR